MRASWNDPLSDAFSELLLETLTHEGEEVALARLLAKLDEADPATRPAHLHLLAMIPSARALEWLEARIESPVVEHWGIAAALLGIRWERLAAWMRTGRPHRLAALDALVAYAVPGEATSALHRAIQPVLADPPPADELRGELTAVVAADDSPRARKTVDEILQRTGEILRGGPSPGITVRAYWERFAAERPVRRRRWSESGGELPVPAPALVAGPDLGASWQRHWNAAVRACERRGGTGSVHVGKRLDRAELAAIEEQLGRPLPGALATLFTEIAGDVEVSWTLPEECEPPRSFKELRWGGCTWDARRLPELESVRARWVEQVFPARDDEYDRVWHDKLAILDVPNGDLVAIDLSRADRAPVVYLSHDDGDGHGRVLGHSVLDFIDRWSRLGCIGPEEWLMTPFLGAQTPYLDPVGESARAWRSWLGLDAMAPA